MSNAAALYDVYFNDSRLHFMSLALQLRTLYINHKTLHFNSYFTSFTLSTTCMTFIINLQSGKTGHACTLIGYFFLNQIRLLWIPITYIIFVYFKVLLGIVGSDYPSPLLYLWQCTCIETKFLVNFQSPKF